jgi:hypothetical protein
MSKTTILVSSTCYDLAAVREDLRRFLMQLGHDPLLSEYPSFPVQPNETTIHNCKKNVETYTDLVVLIVGGRRGALDPATGKSVTNIEYDTAKAHGIPCFVFVNRAMLGLLPIWKKNPSADFSPTVDFPEVFSFIERIQVENHWIFSFEKTGEIQECLSIQLSTMFKDLLGRARVGTIDPTADYANESAKAQKLAREKPKFWEYILTAELLENKLAEVRRQMDRLSNGLANVPTRPINGRMFFAWQQAKLTDLMSAVQAFEKQLPVIQESWGPPGKPGDPRQIRQSVNDLVQLCYGLIDWEKDLRATAPPEPARRVAETMRGWTEFILREVERLPGELLKPLSEPPQPGRVVNILLTIKAPPFDEYQAALEELKSNFASIPPESY